MKHRALILVAASILIFLAASPELILAQSDCGNGLPCGSIPWPQPNPPQLQSPTPMPTVGVTTVPPTQTPGGPTATATPTAVPTSAPLDLDLGGINDQFSTLQSAIEATEQVVEVSGTPVSTGDQLDSIAGTSYTFFQYVRGVASLDLGGLTPFLSFMILTLVVVIAVKTITFLVPILLAIYNFIKGVVDTALSLIP